MKYSKKMAWIAPMAAAICLQADAASARAQTAAGTYEIVEVGESALPVMVEQESDCTEHVIAGQLVLDANGTWELQVTERETCGTETDEDVETENGDYTVTGTAIDFLPEDEDPDDDTTEEIEVDEMVSGTIDGDMLRVRIRDSETIVMFRRTS